MSYKPRALFGLIEEINSSIFLPHIQRPFVWEEDQMLKLFDSLMRSYPIQTLLFWRTKDEIKARKFMDVVEWDPDLSDYYEQNVSQKDRDKTFVLDGQQRLQTLYAIFSGAVEPDDSNGRREAYFDVQSGDEPVDDGLRYLLKFSSEPLHLPWYRVTDLIGKDAQRNAGDLAEEINDALDTENNKLSEDDRETLDRRKSRQKRVRANVGQLVSLLREEKHFWIQTLDGVANDFPYKQVLEIFVRVNSGGTKLDASDLMFAAMKEGWDEIEQVIEDTTELLNGANLNFDKTFPLKCLLVAQGKGVEASAEKFQGADGEALLAGMEKGWSGSEQAFQELRDFMNGGLKIYADKVIRSYVSFMPLFDFLFHNPKPSERARVLMRAYHYKAQLFGWYSSGTDNIVNALHGIVSANTGGEFPLEETKRYFKDRSFLTELRREHLLENRLRFILLNLLYVDQMGSSPFDVKYKGNEPHVDHIYPQHALKTKLDFTSAEVNHIGNFRFIGATDNIRKRAELPASYFSRLRASGVPIEKHLLLRDVSLNPALLKFDRETYLDFRDRRFEAIWLIANSIVNPEIQAT